MTVITQTEFWVQISICEIEREREWKEKFKAELGVWVLRIAIYI